MKHTLLAPILIALAAVALFVAAAGYADDLDRFASRAPVATTGASESRDALEARILKRLLPLYGKSAREIVAELFHTDARRRVAALAAVGSLDNSGYLEAVIEVALEESLEPSVKEAARKTLAQLSCPPFDKEASQLRAWWAEREEKGKRVRELLFGVANEHNDAVHIPQQFWRRQELFLAVNYTFPHVPDCRVALSHDDTLRVLSRNLNTVTSDREGAFLDAINACAQEEQLEIDRDNVERYVRLVLASLGWGRGVTQSSIVEDASGFIVRVVEGRTTAEIDKAERKGTDLSLLLTTDGTLKLLARRSHDKKNARQ